MNEVKRKNKFNGKNKLPPTTSKKQYNLIKIHEMQHIAMLQKKGIKQMKCTRSTGISYLMAIK